MSCSENVNKVVETYIDSLKESSPDKVKEAFHPNGKVVGHLHGDFLEMSTEDLLVLLPRKNHQMLNTKYYQLL